MSSAPAAHAVPDVVSHALARYGCGAVQFAGTENTFYERHLLFDKAIDPRTATLRDQFEAFARSIHDVLARRWALTTETYARENPKLVYYVSMEFLIGRSLANNVTNLSLETLVEHTIAQKLLDWSGLLEQEPDPGLGNGGLGRLAACFLDSMATLQLPAMGYGLRYEYGIFRQSIRDGWQQEQPDNWLRRPDPWEIARPDEAVEVKFGCSFTLREGNLELIPDRPWPLEWFALLLPRHLEIILEINRRFLDDVRARFPGDDGRVTRVSLIEEGAVKHVRMANLAIVGSHSTNGVAGIHTDLLRTTTVRDLAEVFPERFNNKTNGVTTRRWLRLANPALARTISRAIGDNWITDHGQLRRLRPLAADRRFRDEFLVAKRAAKVQFADWLKATAGVIVDPETIFDCQVKRIHEYKRQFLNALRIVVLYNRLREDPDLDMPPRTFFFGGKAAPAYHLAKLIIKFINNLAGTIDGDPAVRGRLRVVFLPEYNVTLAERLIPATDVSNQISTAGYEASGTSNMKFMMNGALTLGTRDGATIEMAEEAGEENFFLFGLTAQQVADTRGWYNPRWHYDHEPETRAALDLIFSDHFSRCEPGVFAPLRDVLRTDHYMHLADLRSYLEADGRLVDLYRNPDAWAHKAILNVAASGRFSSDRTVAEYSAEIWHARPCPVA